MVVGRITFVQQMRKSIVSGVSIYKILFKILIAEKMIRTSGRNSLLTMIKKKTTTSTRVASIIMRITTTIRIRGSLMLIIIIV